MSEVLAGASARCPADWNTFSVGEAFEMQLGKMLSKAFKIGKTPMPYLANKNVQWDRVDLRSLETMDFTEAEREKFSLLPGDLLVCEGGEIGRTAMWHGEMPSCYFQKAIHRLRPRTNDVLPEYMLRYMRLAASNGWLVDFMSQSSIAHLTREQFARVPICVPRPPQQRKIARILTTVDNLIEKTEALIAKYQAIKQGMMHDLFTRGVDEHGHLRPPYDQAPELYKQSQLGWIPKEWDDPRISSILVHRPKNGYSPKESSEWTGVLMLGLGCLTPHGFEPVQLKHAPRNDPQIASALLRNGDLLISRSNTRDLVALVGRYRDVGVPCIYSDLMMRLVPTEAVLPDYMEAVLRHASVRRQLTNASCGTSGSMMKINSEMVLNTVIVLPEKNEQRAILDRVESINRFILKAGDELAKHKETKTGLMQDLLTGKVRVTVDEAEEVAAHA